jgi:hypothetical protein
MLPLQVDINQQLAGLAGIIRREPPAPFIHIPFLLDVDNFADSTGTDDVAYG